MENTITVITKDESSFSEFRERSTGKEVDLNIDEFRTEFSSFYANITNIFGDVEDNLNSLKLDEISIEVEITASGKVGILGTGAESGVKGGLTLKFKRHIE